MLAKRLFGEHFFPSSVRIDTPVDKRFSMTRAANIAYGRVLFYLFISRRKPFHPFVPYVAIVAYVL